MSMLSLQLLLLPLASFLRTATSTTGSNGSCTQESCGDLTIRYPFSLAGVQPLYCGYPAFDLNCDAGTGRAYLSNTFREHLFLVRNISYANNFMVAAVRTAFAGDSGCPVPDFNVSASLALFPFNISATNKRLVFFYNCTVPTEFSLPRLQCANHTMGAYISDRSWDAGEGGTPPQGVPTNCSSVSVPVRRGMERAHLHYKQLISDGFLLELPAPLGDCEGCRQRSGGECRLDQFAFQCVCPDGKLCPNSTRPSSTTPPDTGADDVGIKIVTGITSAVLFVIILGLVCHLIQLNRTKNKKRSASLDGLIREGSPLASLRKEFNLAGSPRTYIFTYEELDAATDGFSNANELGAGGFGTVYKGVLRDGSVVAVKRLYKNSYKGVEQFANEVDILSRLRHPNLVALYGCTSSSATCRDLLLVYEFVPNGTLADHLHGQDGGGEPLLLAWPTRLGIAVKTAAALAYLHAHQVVHRDVKTTNILLDDGFHVKVADFGLSRLFPADGATQHVSTAPQGTPGYVDPAYHHRYQLTDKSDVYSFGVVLMELVSSRMAVDMARAGTDVNLGSMAVRMIQCCEIDRLVDPRLGYGPASATKGTIDLVAEVAFRCLQPEQDVRPSIGEVLNVLRQTHQRITEKGASATTDGAVTTRKELYPDGQNNADGCRRPRLSYADSQGQAVGLYKPSGYRKICRRPPSAQISRRHIFVYAYNSRRHTCAVGIDVGPAARRETEGSRRQICTDGRDGGRRHILPPRHRSAAPAMSSIRGTDLSYPGQSHLPSAYIGASMPVLLKKSRDGSPDSVMHQWISPSTTSNSS